jgi:TonB family protein
MRDRPFLLAALFSLGLHGGIASFFIPSLAKVSLEKPTPLAIVWEKTRQTPSQKTVYPMNLKIPGLLRRYAPRNDEENSVIASGAKQSRNKIDSSVIRKVNHSLDSPRSNAETQRKHEAKLLPVESPRQTYKPDPEYPWICRKRHQEGTVLLSVGTNAEGHVIKMSLLKSSGYAALDEAALNTIKSWIFAEGNHHTTIQYVFRLEG